MFKVLQNWVHRYFSDEQAVVLAVLLIVQVEVVQVDIQTTSPEVLVGDCKQRFR